MVVHSMVMVLSLEQAVVASRGVEAVAEYLVAGEGSVVGGNKVQVVAWGPRWNQWGLDISKGQLNLLWRLTNDQSPSPVILTNSLKRW